MYRNQQRRVTMCVTVPHESFEFPVRNVPRSRFLERDRIVGAFACAIKTQEFFFDDLDVGIRLPCEID